ncbi:MAG: chemotaxis response regulator protein-glutamate methylesterase [Gammaproteobacteria bacterium]
MNRVGVVIVDDSAVVRQVLAAELGRDPGIEVIAACPDPLLALERMKARWPDVILTDVEMPRMDGVTFVRKIMSERPTPIVVCSSLTETGAATTVQVLAAGAVQVVAKPRLAVKQFLLDAGESLADAVKSAARARVARMLPAQVKRPVPTPGKTTAIEAMARTTDRVVAIGTSTGGTQALETVLTALQADCPGIVVVQHMPERFTAAFAARLNGLCDIEVREAAGGDRVMTGRALIAPGGRHMRLVRSGAQYQVEIVDGPPVNRHRPSVDVLFNSVAKVAGRNALGIIMTGMGDDGAAGLAQMRCAGARTLGQDEASCVVYGMPAAAMQRGAVEREIPLGQIAGEIARIRS